MRNRPAQSSHPATDRVEPALLRRVNARHVLDALLELGPCTRTALRDHTGISAPTMSKLIDHLMKKGLVEEAPESLLTAGRPSKVFGLACTTAHVVGVVIDIDEIRIFACGLDGRIDDGAVRVFRTPRTYGKLLSRVTDEVESLARKYPAPCLGMGVSVPGLLDAREGRIMLSPNLRFLDNARLAADLAERLDFDAIIVQEERALCLAEQLFGAARGLDDFAMIDISAGLGMGVVSGGRFVGGRDGFGGELGHITVDPRGIRCGCGNRGCLETVATDRVFARMVEKKAGRSMSVDEASKNVDGASMRVDGASMRVDGASMRVDGASMNVDEAIELVRSGKIRCRRELIRMIGFLARGLGVVVNLFNPAGVFVYGRLFDAREGLFDELVTAVGDHALKPSLAACSIVRSRGSKKQGAAAAVIAHLFQGAGPSIQPS